MHVAVGLKLASIPVAVHLIGFQFHPVDCDLNVPLKSNHVQWLDRLNCRSYRNLPANHAASNVRLWQRVLKNARQSLACHPRSRSIFE
jgi:hypothetical protein